MRAERRRASAGLVGVCLCVALLWAGWHWQTIRRVEQQRQRGAALFHGERSLAAQLNGHSEVLPATAARCSNCHEALSRPPLAAATGSNNTGGPARPYAGVIQGDTLTTPHPRRGGPPSAYDEARLCTLLRTGVDAAQVMIPNTMPRYDVTPADCADLWAFLRS